MTFERLRRDLLDGTVPPERKDSLLGALVRAGRVDPDAWLAVIVCLVPGLRRAGRRFGHALGGDEAAAILVGAVWERLRTYDLARRPQRVAANLVWDAIAALVRASRQQRRWDGTTRPLGRAENHRVDEPELSAEAIFAMAVDAGVLTPRDVVLIDATRRGGMPMSDAARVLGIGYEAAKKRRQRAEAGWAGWWAPEAVEGRRARAHPAA